MLVLIVTLALLASGCTPATPEGPRTLTVMTHDSFAMSDDVLAAFEEANNVKVTFLKAGDTGSALNQAILAKGSPLADVFYGVDNTFLSRALTEDIFEPYAAPALAQIPDAFELDPKQRLLPVDYGDVCLNYDLGWFEQEGLAPPASLADLAAPAYQGLSVVTNPATSSPGLAFLFATIAAFGEEGYLDYWLSLKGNDVRIVNDWESAYYTEFTRAGGDRPIVLSYGSSPAFEMIYADPPLEKAPTGALVSANACFRQVEFVGILRGTQKRDLAEQWIDFMLSTAFQEDMPLNMFVFPVLPEAKLDPAFEQYLFIPAEPANLPAELIDAQRESWIQEWTESILR
jgi:thiamine transport system substrate-binding protein